jgi:predicted lipoprotein with Yx(FWY)xxD motif
MLRIGAPAAVAQGARAADGPPEGLPAGIGATRRGDGWKFTAAASGMTLYTYDRDEGAAGSSACVAECAELWPPMLAATDTRASGAWSLIARPDGARQWAFRGKPLYRYASDAFAGATFGDGVDTVWRIAFRPMSTPRELGIGASTLGAVLTDAQRRTVYTSSRDQPGREPACQDACLRSWKPIVAPALANGFADFGVVVRADGLRQWAYKGQPLYRNAASDVAPGELLGHGVNSFSAVVLEPMPPRPSWITVQPSDAGELLADDKGLTLYTHGDNARGRRRYMGQVMCPDGACIDPEWQPVMAAPDAKPIGSWAIVEVRGGGRQWAYKGQKLYTHALDKRPGEFKGIRFGGDRSWSAIMRDGQPMQGVSVGG